MDKQLASKLLVVLSVVFGITIALLAIFRFDGMWVVAVVGGLLLGLLWVLNSMFGKDRSTSA